jgi:hypothetical protein
MHPLRLHQLPADERPDVPCVFARGDEMSDEFEPRHRYKRKAEAPSLEELRSRQCTLEELQAAMVKFIDLYNEQGRRVQDAINKKQDREWRATM